MRKTHIIKEKKTYSAPQVDMIRLDNEISLQLASGEEAKPIGDPTGNGWDVKANQQHSNDPYKMA